MRNGVSGAAGFAVATAQRWWREEASAAKVTRSQWATACKGQLQPTSTSQSAEPRSPTAAHSTVGLFLRRENDVERVLLSKRRQPVVPPQYIC